MVICTKMEFPQQKFICSKKLPVIETLERDVKYGQS